MKPTLMIPLAAALTLVACTMAPRTTVGQPTPAPAASTLLGDWLVQSVDDQPLAEPGIARLSFGADGRLTGNASCNNLMGRFEHDGSKLTIGNLATTRKACPPPLMDQEQRVLAALGRASTAQVDGGQLVLGIDGKRLMVGARPPAPNNPRTTP